ncbi:MAG TPA: hypothetical protein VEX13_11230, partial [Chloroflexia bacterium]|nr:hypothetical protein [Chloroflexia bacterium]
STRLKDMSMAEVAQTLYGSDDILLSELMWARETAQQWVVPVAIDHATREAKTLEFIELAEKDYNNSAFRAKVERAFPHTEITAGNRGTEDWLVYFRSYHGLSLDLVPDFRPHGIYFKNYKAQEDAWRAYQQGLRDHHGAQLPQAGSNRNGKGRGRPIHAEPKLEQMVYEELSGYLAGTSVPPAQAPPRHQPPQPRHRPYIRRRRKP